MQQRFIYNNELLLVVPVAEAHSLGIVSCGIHTAHETLVVAEEEDGQAGDDADNIEEGLFVKAMGNVVFGQTALQRRLGLHGSEYM